MMHGNRLWVGVREPSADRIWFKALWVEVEFGDDPNHLWVRTLMATTVPELRATVVTMPRQHQVSRASSWARVACV